MDTSTSSFTAENSVNHLNSAANILPPSACANILKSYYLTKCRTITLASLFNLPQRFTKETVRCPKCCVQYEDAKALCRIKPERKQSKFARKLLEKHKNGNDDDMTGYQKKYLKNLIHKGDIIAYNTLVITCGVCKNESKEKLKKPKRSPPITDSNTPQSAQSTVIKSHKTKKKKDRFSGLNKEAVLSATPTPNTSFNTSNFVPLETTPNAKVDGKKKKNVNNKKNLFIQNNNNRLDKIEKTKTKKMEKKNKEKKLKGLQNILNNSKRKSSPSATLKQFLTSI